MEHLNLFIFYTQTLNIVITNIPSINQKHCTSSISCIYYLEIYRSNIYIYCIYIHVSYIKLLSMNQIFMVVCYCGTHNLQYKYISFERIYTCICIQIRIIWCVCVGIKIVQPSAYKSRQNMLYNKSILVCICKCHFAELSTCHFICTRTCILARITFICRAISIAHTGSITHTTNQRLHFKSYAKPLPGNLIATFKAVLQQRRPLSTRQLKL